MTAYWNKVCALPLSPLIPIPPRPPMRDTQGRGVQEVNTIVDLVGYPASIAMFRQEGINNAFAVLGHPNLVGDEAIIYDPSLLNRLDAQYGRAAPVAVLAHEVGHIVVGVHIPGWIADWSDEMRADYFAGYVLGRFRISRRPIQNWLQNEGLPDHRHPDGFTRAGAIEHGYINGGGNPWDL